MRKTLTILLIIYSTLAFSFPNCEVLKEDENCYKACLLAEEALDKNHQGSTKFQELLLKSIDLCPTFAQSYFELSVPYAKRGLMHEWIPILNKAIELAPAEFLGWRGWYHWFFMRNYEKAIADIDSLNQLVNYDIGHTGDGKYHLLFLKGMCYRGLGQYEQAIDIMENCFLIDEYLIGVYDYLHLGVLYLETGQISNALEMLEKQIEYNPVAESYFYYSLALEKNCQKKEALEQLQISHDRYQKGYSMHDPYIELPDEIYLSDIEEKMKEMKN